MVSHVVWYPGSRDRECSIVGEMKRAEINKQSPDEIPADALYRLLVNSLPVGVFLMRDGIFQFVNETFAGMFGYDIPDIVGKFRPVDLAAEGDKAKLAEAVCHCLRGDTRELRHGFHGLRKDARRTYVEMQGTLVESGGGAVILGTVTDNTGHFRADEILKETSARYRKFFEEDIAPHYVTATSGAIVDCNAAFLELFRFSSKEEALSIDASSLFPMPSERARFIELIKERRELKGFKAEYLRRDGKRIYVVENAVGEFDSVGNIIGIRGYLLNETNERQLQGELFQSQRLETLGTLVGGIAHDFNNILTVIVGHASLMEKWRPNPDKFSRSFEAVNKAAGRGANIVKQLLTFARKVDIVTEPVKVDKEIGEIIALLEETFPENITFNVDIEPEIPSIHADGNQIHQVLLNLCVNARDAMPEGGVLRVKTKTVNGKVLNRRFRDVENESYVLVEISDNGNGMDRVTLGHVFEPFFTTKQRGRGTGLGLAVVYGIMKAHRGFVDVRSEVGEGTTFSLYFPIPVNITEASAEERTDGDSPEGNGELLLVIEDEEPLMDFLKIYLEENGYSVLTAPDGLKGLLTYKKHMEGIKAVILDMGLPEMTGVEVLEELKRLNPDVRVMLASGYLEPKAKADAFRAGATDFLSKPYQGNSLLTKVHNTLEKEHKIQHHPA